MTNPTDAEILRDYVHGEIAKHRAEQLNGTPDGSGRCDRCRQPRPLFQRPMEGGKAIRVCARCWSLYQEARDKGTFLDWSDAFDNATDEQIACRLAGGAQ